jgi:hypothetical protein
LEESFLNVPRVWTGRNVIAAGGGKEYEFQVSLSNSFFAEADTKYWLEIAQIGDPASSFRWEFSQSPPQNGQAFNNEAVPNWMTTFPNSTSNTAFQLYSIPEPSSLALLGTSLPMLVRSRCRRTSR